MDQLTKDQEEYRRSAIKDIERAIKIQKRDKN